MRVKSLERTWLSLVSRWPFHSAEVRELSFFHALEEPCILGSESMREPLAKVAFGCFWPAFAVFYIVLVPKSFTTCRRAHENAWSTGQWPPHGSSYAWGCGFLKGSLSGRSARGVPLRMTHTCAACKSRWAPEARRFI